MKYYLIQRLNDHAYYSLMHREFAGILYAAIFECLVSAEEVIEKLCNKDTENFFTIIEVYKNFYKGE